ncbi:TBC1 domain family member 19 isoform X2 [Callorhinchus milii]|uniref:TBC1 domain family, member 19 n=1 Tax=Callorhinchus milii TaxID=7868 RepID=A0A4W3I545_CALMI|nr:TBC1 domain family member 19 isoform X2 [Callorhinchus milii]|eukprot:gi/632943994/ref/XP_007887259.1/ PREDICTED: TBC1 domain family member 19 isoform X1 [Callorhinchus milii]
MEGVAAEGDVEADGQELSATIAYVVKKLKSSQLHSELEREARTSLHKSEIRIDTLKEDLKVFLQKSGWEKKLQNAVYRELNVLPPPSHPSAPIEHIKEALAYMRRAQVYWEKRVLKSLNSMCTELNIPLAQKRSLDDQKELLNKWNEMGTDEPDLSQFRPVYAPKDFLEVLINLRNPNYDIGDQNGLCSNWGLINIPLPVKGLPELRELFAELGLNYGQLGIDDSIQIPTDLFESDHVRLGQKVLSEQDSAAAQQYIRQGCPTGLRADTWALILNISNQMEDSLYYDQLKSNVIQHDLLVDSLIYKDVKLTASNDDYYFVFEDYLYQVLLCFSRDTMVLDHFSYSSASPPRSYIRGKLGLEDYAVVYPPNGVIPFHGFAMYVAPLCFLYHEPSKLYQVFREMYVRYFFRLHSISSHPSGIVSLCLLFETLVQTYLPQLFYRLREIGAQPLRISFKWMVRAFSGYLATDQLLFLWDRILGYNSLEILAVLAAAVFAFRAENLMEATSLAAAEIFLANKISLKR